MGDSLKGKWLVSESKGYIKHYHEGEDWWKEYCSLPVDAFVFWRGEDGRFRVMYPITGQVEVWVGGHADGLIKLINKAGDNLDGFTFGETYIVSLKKSEANKYVGRALLRNFDEEITRLSDDALVVRKDEYGSFCISDPLTGKSKWGYPSVAIMNLLKAAVVITSEHDVVKPVRRINVGDTWRAAYINQSTGERKVGYLMRIVFHETFWCDKTKQDQSRWLGVKFGMEDMPEWHGQYTYWFDKYGIADPDMEDSMFELTRKRKATK